MSVVSLLGVNVLNNPAPFTAPYEFEITFECLEQLQKGMDSPDTILYCRASLTLNLRSRVEVDLRRLCYLVSLLESALKSTASTDMRTLASSEHDQELDSLLVGPIPVGVNKFLFEADPPNLKRIPTSEILGVTVILLTCSYDGREFVRVGYYVNNEYDTPELIAEPPAKTVVERVRRNLLAEKPRVTRFNIKWFVSYHRFRNGMMILTTLSGIRKSLLRPSSLPSSPRPIWLMTMVPLMVRKRKRRRRPSKGLKLKWKREPKVPSKPGRPPMPRWPVRKTQPVQSLRCFRRMSTRSRTRAVRI